MKKYSSCHRHNIGADYRCIGGKTFVYVTVSVDSGL